MPTLLGRALSALAEGWRDFSALSAIVPMPIGMVSGRGGSLFTRANFRGNLARETGGVLEGAHAHHGLPLKFADAFGRAGINIHDPRFGAWWEAGSHLKNASAFNAEWETFLSVERTQAQILEFGKKINERYGVQVKF